MSSKQKYEKSQKIAQSALKLFEESSFDEITMEKIAQDAGVAKGTLFNYYKTKENIFMNLLLEGYQIFFIHLDEEISEIEKFTFIDFKHFMLRTTSNLIKNHQVLVRLNALRGQILEKKADREQTILGRQKLYLISEQLSRDVAARVEGLSPEAINHLFITQGAIISGLINLAGLEKFNNEKLPIQVFDFEVNIEKEAKEILGFYLDGLVKKNEVDG